MKFGPIRQIFRPLFGLKHRETTTRFLYAILISALIIDVAMIVFRLLDGVTVFDTTLKLLIGLLVSSMMLLLLVRRGYIDLLPDCLLRQAGSGLPIRPGGPMVYTTRQFMFIFSYCLYRGACSPTGRFPLRSPF